MAGIGGATALMACGSSTGSSLGGATSDGAVLDSPVDGTMGDGAGSADAASRDSGIADASGSDGAVAVADTGPPGSARAKLVAERALAQVGFAIAMASSVLQTQLHVIFGSLFVAPDAGDCLPLQGGGSSKPGPSPIPIRPYDFFYDSNCTRPYVDVAVDAGNLFADAGPVDAAPVDGAAPAQFVETIAYHGLDGGPLGVLALTQSLALETSADGGLLAYLAYGTGIFAPANGATGVQLGLSCRIDLAAGTMVCAGGVAQDFPALSLALGSVTPLALTSVDGGSALGLVFGSDGGVAFSGTGSMVVAGALGSLTLGTPVPPALAIDGGTAYTSMDTDGGAGALAFFPPKPTGWTIVDSTHDEQFQITLLDDTTRNLAATITQISTGATLATATIDQSGTGTITYSDGSTAAITSWTLAD
jgi:hypothetical protein